MVEIMEKEFYCYRSGLKIYAKEFIDTAIWEQIMAENTGGKKIPAIIVSHGFGGNSTGSEKYCQAFAGEGYAAYCFDFCGGSRDGEGRSEGSSLDMTIQTECLDLLTLIDNIKAFSYIDEKHMILMGFSQGGFISALAAAELPGQIEKLIMLFPALCIPDDARRGRLGGAAYDTEDVPAVIHCSNEMNVSRKYHDNVVNMDPFKEIAGFDGEVLLIQGMKDAIVNYSYAVKARESYRAGQCHLHLIKEGGHSITETQQESTITAIIQFLKGKKEQLTIHVILTEHAVLEDTGDYHKRAVYFTGYCDNDIFKGCILPGGVDIQEQHRDEPMTVRADYTLQGIDAAENCCTIHIVNQKRGSLYKPVIETNSSTLAYLSELDMTAALECFPGGLTVRIFG